MNIDELKSKEYYDEETKEYRWYWPPASSLSEIRPIFPYEVKTEFDIYDVWEIEFSKWMKENIEWPWITWALARYAVEPPYYFGFFDETDAMAFKLKWS